MPRSFSEEERVRIIQRLKKSASDLLSVYGARKTTVDMIVQKASVPKGSFYLFYPSKEMLFWDVILDYHNAISEVLHTSVTSAKHLDAQQFTDILFNTFIAVSKSFYPSLMVEGEMEFIMRKLPEDLVAAHHNDDADMLSELASVFPKDSPIFKDKKKVDGLSGALRILFFSLLHRREIGESVYDYALRVLLRGIADELFDTYGGAK